MAQPTPAKASAPARLPFDRDALHAELIRDEGLKLQPYRDTKGLLTVGVGRNLDRGDGGVTAAEQRRLGITPAGVRKNGLTHAQAIALLDGDIDASAAGLDAKLPWWRGLDPVRQRVMLNLAHMGLGDRTHGLLSFVNTLPAIRDGRWADAAHGLLTSKYADDTHDRAKRLATMLLTGKPA
jgi:lysozyme